MIVVLHWSKVNICSAMDVRNLLLVYPAWSGSSEGGASC